MPASVPFVIGIYGPAIPPATAGGEATITIQLDLNLAYEQLFTATYTRQQAGDPLDSSITNALAQVLSAKAS